MPASGNLPVVAVAPEVAMDRAIEADLAQVAIVRHCETGDALLDLVLSRQVTAAVVGLLDQDGASIVPFIAKARGRNPGLRIVVDLPATRVAFQQVPAMLKAGACEVAIRGYDRLGESIRTVLAVDLAARGGAGAARGGVGDGARRR